QHKPLFFNQSFDGVPVFVASMQDTVGGNTATLRRQSHNATRARLFVEEEQSLDAEMAHSGEVAGGIAIEGGTIVGSNSAFPAQSASAEFSDVPVVTYLESDGTLGEGIALASGHTDGGHHHNGHNDDGLCGCDQCCAMREAQEAQGPVAAVTQTEFDEIVSDNRELSSIFATQAGADFAVSVEIEKIERRLTIDMRPLTDLELQASTATSRQDLAESTSPVRQGVKAILIDGLDLL
ncbi:MAG: hypothetical protein AAF497_26595, partial [Planctomycetota bacterium]